MTFKALLKLTVNAICVVALFSGPAQSYACGFDGLLGNGFSALHPRSVQVAFAIRDAVDDRLTPASVLTPITPGSVGYWRAIRHLKGFHKLLSATAHGQAETPPISILFIDSNLWTRFHSADSRIEASVHRTGAERGDVEIVTSEAILVELLEERISIAKALDRGLIELRGAGAAAAERWLRDAFEITGETALNTNCRGFPLFGKPRTK